MNSSNSIKQSARTSSSINNHIARMASHRSAQQSGVQNTINRQSNRRSGQQSGQPTLPINQNNITYQQSNHPLDENEELLKAVPTFDKNIVSLILSYRIIEPIYKVVFHCSLCDVDILRNAIFNHLNPYEWELPCHPLYWGSNWVTAFYTIETEYNISIYKYTGQCDTSGDW